MNRLKLVRLSSIAVAILCASSALADPPARVARLNLTDGTVSFRPAGLDDWAAAAINRPLVNGDTLWTDTSSRAEIHIGSAAVRLGASTSFALVNENDRIAQMKLTSGTAAVRVRRAGENDVWEIDTPNSSVSLLKPGSYRVDVTSDGLTTIVTARGGEAEVTAGAQAFPLHAGEQASIAGTSDRTHEMAAAAQLDDFDRWCRDRDRREDRYAAAHHVPRELVGYEDLDEAGTWRMVAGYGWVWAPASVAAGWAPYRYGHWAWIDPWGWTWIDDAPWGFAPFHYGRWAYVAGGWVWVPGTIVRPVYAPALVAFGGGARWSVSGGAIAWWPLAPGEVFVPAYAVAPVYVRNINAPVVPAAQLNSVTAASTNAQYANRPVSGAVTAVPQTAFAGSRPVAASAIPVSASQIASAPALGSTAAVAPRPESVLGGPATANRARPPAAVASRDVVSKTPPPPPPVPFAAKQSALAQNPGHPLDGSAEHAVRKSTNAARPKNTKSGSAPPQKGSRPGQRHARKH